NPWFNVFADSSAHESASSAMVGMSSGATSVILTATEARCSTCSVKQPSLRHDYRVTNEMHPVTGKSHSDHTTTFRQLPSYQLVPPQTRTPPACQRAVSRSRNG